MTGTKMAMYPAPSASFVSQITTGAVVENHTFVWRIENYNVVRRSNELISAQQFTFQAGSTINLPSTWRCHLVSEQHEGKKWIGVFICLIAKPLSVKEVNVAFTVNLVKPNGNDRSCMASLKNLADTNVCNWGFSKILERDLKVEELPLFNGALSIDVEFNIYATKPPEVTILDDLLIRKLSLFKYRSIRRWSVDLSGLQSNPQDATTRIICKDGKVFPVNRCILAGSAAHSRSTVFRAMFQTPMKEKETGEIYIEDLSSKTIQVLLQYISYGSLLEDWNSAEVLEELTYAAHKYQLGLLLEFLNDVLGRVCTMDNVKQLAVLAKRTGMKVAEKELFLFLRENAKSIDDLTILMEGA